MRLDSVVGALLLAGTALVGAMAPGVAVLWNRHRENLLAMSAGLLAGTAAIDLLPQATPLGGVVGAWFLGGFLGVMLLEAGLHRAMAPRGTPVDGADPMGHTSISAVIGFALHGLVDGVALHSAGESGNAGITTAALVTHHFPLAVSCASILRAGARPALFWPLMILGAMMPSAGVMLSALALAESGLVMHLAAVAAGVFVYVAGHNLMPVMDLRREAWPRFVAVFVGAGLVGLGHLLGD